MVSIQAPRPSLKRQSNPITTTFYRQRHCTKNGWQEAGLQELLETIRRTHVHGMWKHSRVSVFAGEVKVWPEKQTRTRWDKRVSRCEIASRKENKKWMSMTWRVRVCTAGLYCALDNNLAVFLFEYLRKHRDSRFTIKHFLLIRAVRVCEEGALVVHEEVSRFGEVVKCKLLMDEGQR